MWGVARAAVSELSAGTAHIALRDGIAAKLPRLRTWYEDREEHRTKRDSVLSILHQDSRVSRVAKFILSRRYTAMINRIWGNDKVSAQRLCSS